MPVVDHTKGLDYFGHRNDTLHGRTSGGLYFYLLTEELIKDGTSNVGHDPNIIASHKIIVPPTNAVQSVVVQPYVDEKDVDYTPINFDYKRFKIDGMDETSTELDNVPMTVNRIDSILKPTVGVKDLGTFTKYKPIGNNFSGRSWANESKLLQYPYTYGMLFDNITEPLEVFYHQCPDTNTPDVSVRVPLSNQGTYNLFIKGYKGDANGYIEGKMSVKPLNIPVTSSAYTNFMSTSASSHATQQRNTIVGAVGSTLGGAVIGGMTGGVGGAVVGGLAGLGGGVMNAYQTTQSALATEKDLKTTPNIVQSMGSDVLFNLLNTNGFLVHYRMQLEEEYLRKIGDYFALYGYKQNKVMKVDTRSRHYYNYVKTIGANVSSDAIPKEHLQTIKNIYDSGVTMWHITRKGVKVGDYSKDNTEF